MALSYTTVQEAYAVFHALRISCLPDLRIPSWPSDMAEWNDDEKSNPPTLQVLGWDKKYDDGWENLIFFIENPSEEVIARFKKLNIIKSNTSICEPYNQNPKLWCFGWL